MGMLLRAMIMMLSGTRRNPIRTIQTHLGIALNTGIKKQEPYTFVIAIIPADLGDLPKKIHTGTPVI